MLGCTWTIRTALSSAWGVDTHCQVSRLGLTHASERLYLFALSPWPLEERNVLVPPTATWNKTRGLLQSLQIVSFILDDLKIHHRCPSIKKDRTDDDTTHCMSFLWVSCSLRVFSNPFHCREQGWCSEIRAKRSAYGEREGTCAQVSAYVQMRVSI